MEQKEISIRAVKETLLYKTVHATCKRRKLKIGNLAKELRENTVTEELLDTDELSGAFIFDGTPQGAKYWQLRTAEYTRYD